MHLGRLPVLLIMPKSATQAHGQDLDARKGGDPDRASSPKPFYPAPAKVDVRAIRAGLGLSKTAFARRQGRRQPEAAARVLLLVIASKPEVVDDLLAAAMPRAA